MDEFELSPLEEKVLTILLNREFYGLEIIKALEEASEGKIRIGFGSLYPTLHKLEKKGFVKSQWGEDRPEERAGARRKYYRVEGVGEEALAETQRIRNSLSTWQPS
jgi:PadR family transcriptional regulator, regulatory protein PadR